MKYIPALCGALLMGATVFLAFVFPATVEQWSREERELSAVQLLLVSLGDLAQSFWFVLFPIGVALVFLSLVFVVKDHKKRVK